MLSKKLYIMVLLLVEIYLNYSPEEVKEGGVNKDDEEDEPEDNEQEDCEEESTLPLQEPEKPHSASMEKKFCKSKIDINWVGKMADGKALYMEAILR